MASSTLQNDLDAKSRGVSVTTTGISTRGAMFRVWVMALLATFAAAQLVESDRVAAYHARNYTWPVTKFIPDTPGWKALFDERFRQIEEIENSGERYEGYMQAVYAAAIAPNLTQFGFALAKCPDELTKALQQGIREGLATARHENAIEVIDAPEQPLFIDRPDLTRRVLHDLKDYAEAWVGIKLTPHTAYGFRLYQNHSQLTMHIDKKSSHVISFILHIDSSEDAEPWPIFIEDYHGRTHEVILTPGDMLFYESSKCFHGRPRRLNGSWYSSVFVHYYPTSWQGQSWNDRDHQLEAHYAIPPHWKNPAPTIKTQNRLRMVGTSLKEPDCPSDWCRSKDTVKWSGPGEEGVWIDPNFERHPFHPGQTRDEL